MPTPGCVRCRPGPEHVAALRRITAGEPLMAFVWKRLLGTIPSLVGVVVLTFFISHALPGDPAAYFAGPAANAESIAQTKAKLGLDKSLPEQFFKYAGDLLHGNLGTSLTTGQPVLSDLTARLPASLELTTCALVLAVVVAIPMGVWAATRPRSEEHTSE